MARQWSRIVVEEDPGVTEVYSNGRMLAGLNVAMCDEDVQATRQGYKCITCFENLDEAWPEFCPVCSYPIRDRQAEQFAQAYKGYDPTARTGADWDRLADQLEERKERRAFAKRAKESGISLAGASVGEAIKRMKGAR